MTTDVRLDASDTEFTGAETSALTRWLTENGFGSGDASELTPIGGGTQNIMAQLTFGGRQFVVRRGPRHLRPNSNNSILREARVLRALAQTNVPHPGMIAVCDDADVLGGAVFFLMEPVAGFNPSLSLPELHATDADVRRRMCLNLMDASAALGQVDYKAVGLDGFGKPAGFLERQVTRWLSELDGYNSYDGYDGPQIPGVTAIAAWLEAHRPTDWQPGIMHGDLHFANAMFRSDSAEVAAVVDWEMSTIGDPLLDLGWTLATWQLPHVPGMFGSGLMAERDLPSPDELAEQYAKTSSRDLEFLEWYVVLACFKLGILLEGTHARACAGMAPKKTGDELHQTTVLLFERALAKI